MTDGEIVLSAVAFGTSAWALGATVAACLMMRGQISVIAPLRKEMRNLIARIDDALSTSRTATSASTDERFPNLDPSSIVTPKGSLVRGDGGCRAAFRRGPAPLDFS